MSPDLHRHLQLSANVVRGLAMDAVERATCGHPGMPMGMADAAVVLWTRHLRFDPESPDWRGRDRFVLSAGHGSMLLYSLLHLAGYPLSVDDLRNFRQWHSRTPGHPELGATVGVETTTGPLGQGFGNGVGLALGAKMAAARFDNPLLATRVFAVVSDGDVMEGVAHEAASLAGHLRLDNLVYLYDDNSITIDGRTDLAFSEDVCARFEALGWHTAACDGHDMAAVDRALTAAIAADRPALIRCTTTIGKGSPNKQDTSGSHGAALGADEVRRAKEHLGLAQEDFWVPDEALEPFAAAAARGTAAREEWLRQMADWRSAEPTRAAALDGFWERRAPDDLFDRLQAAVGDAAGATRGLSGKAIQALAAAMPGLVGGSADLDSSTKTRIADVASVQAGSYGGRNLHFGVREHAMGAICNGLALHGGFLPMGSTFLVFADYMRPTIRLAALMQLPVTFVFTHDSLMVGEDGPTHQPVEQTASLRLIPNLTVWRPADGCETAAAWAAAAARRDGPSALILTRQDLPRLQWSATGVAQVRRGAAVLHDPQRAVAVVIATGSEVHTTLEAAAILDRAGTPVRVVSMPSVEEFQRQPAEFRDTILPFGLPVCAVEMGIPDGWSALTGDPRRVLGVSTFGTSAPAEKLMSEYGFDPDSLATRLRAALGPT